MNWRRLFRHDMGRKSLSLGLAYMVWILVNAGISDEARKPFTVVDASGEGTGSRDHEVRVHVPDGWILLEPQFNQDIDILFYGPLSEIADFYSSGCNAEITLRPTVGPQQIQYNLTVLPEDLDWLKAEEARKFLVLDRPESQTKIEFHLERKATETVTLEPTLVTITGSVDSTYSADVQRMTFDRSQVVISGPKSKVEQLVTDIQAARRAANATLEFLEPISVQDARHGDLVRNLRLSESVRNQGITMDPDVVVATLPINLALSIPFLAKEPVPIGTPPGGTRWKADPWSDKRLTATLAVPRGKIPFDEAFVQNNVRLYLPLDLLPESANEFDLPVEFFIEGVRDPDQFHFYRSNLILKAPDGNWPTVKMRRDTSPAPEEERSDGGE